MPFSKLGLAKPILEGVRAMGWTDPTPIQLRAIPLLLEGRDVIGSAQTGTGKTGAFSLPFLSKIGKAHGKTRVLILEPTRELASQVETAIRDYARFTDLTVAVIYGGVGYGKQVDALKNGVDVIVATPGRLLDHMRQRVAKMDSIDFVVLDEADRMLDMGFLPDVKQILQKCPKERQTALFSATIPPEIETLITWAMNDPETIEIGMRRSPKDTINHVIYPVAEKQKLDLLFGILEGLNYDSVIIFTRTKVGADRISGQLKRKNHAVATLHSDRTQRDREKALKGFRDGKYEVMVATDIASRGLDITNVSHVINYDVPQHPEDYVHRIGRTGRHEATGDAFTLMVAEDVQHVDAIERFIGRNIERAKLDDFKYTYTTILDEKRFKGVSVRDRKMKTARVGKGQHFGFGGRRGGRRRR
ncbi:MAG: RNA helicase [Rhodospirillaceae bacterium]|nr:RNA helicase [Rhodospirillaceae bacterium]